MEEKFEFLKDGKLFMVIGENEGKPCYVKYGDSEAHALAFSRGVEITKLKAVLEIAVDAFKKIHDHSLNAHWHDPLIMKTVEKAIADIQGE